MTAITADMSRPFTVTKAAPVYLGTYRLLLAVFVFSTHSSWNFVRSWTNSDAGNIGVMCFFIISGYLITLALEQHYAHNPGRFLLNRFLRIYPLLWLSIAVAALVIVSMGTLYVASNFFLRGWAPTDILQSLLVVTAFPNSKWGPMPVGWTLTVEVDFYLIMAAIYFLFGRSAAPVRHVLTIASCVVALGVNLYFTSINALWWSNGIHFVPFFVVGVATAILSRVDSSRPGTQVFTGAILWIAIAMSLNVVARFNANSYIPPLTTPFAFFFPRAEQGMVTGTLITMMVLMAVFFILASSPFALGLDRFRKVDDLLGDLTYPLYTLHYALVQLCMYWMPVGWHPHHLLWAEGTELAVCLGAAYLALRYVDRPLRRLRNKVRGTEIRKA